MGRREIIFFLLVLGVAVLVRFYNFRERVTFGPEQGMSLITSGNYLQEKFTLLGQKYFRQIRDGRTLFASAVFNYSLVPMMLLSNFDPIKITAIFALLNIGTGVVLFFTARKMYGFAVAIWSLVLFVFSARMIEHSLFIWILDFAPLLGILAFYTWKKFGKGKNLVNSIILGILVGLAVGIDYFYLLPAVLVLLGMVFILKRKAGELLMFVLGAVLGNLPLVLFDLRHDFYHVRTLSQYIFETLQSPGQSEIHYYHFLYLWPIFAVFGGILLKRVFDRNRWAAVFLAGLFVTINLTSPHVAFKRAVGMVPGMGVSDFEDAARIIAGEKPVNFNVAALVDFDSRAYPLRYLVKFTHGFTPNSVEDYPNSGVLYVFAGREYDFDKALAWEINSFKPFEIVIRWEINPSFSLYKLVKTKV